MPHGDARPFPFPFRAGLAISNDIDNASFDEFAALHRWINGDLGLEVGDSFWLYTNGSPGADAFTYCRGVSDERSEFADAMDALIDAGYLDSLHTWGNFSERGGFTRALAVRGARLLARHAGRIPVWINHGDEWNEQMAARAGWDDPAAPNGEADQMAALGIRYLWTGSVTSIVGQEYARTPRVSAMARIRERYLRPAIQTLRGAPLGNRFYGRRIMRPLDAAGHRFATFVRFGVWDRATRNDLEFLLSDENLQMLVDCGGASIVYVHLFQVRDKANDPAPAVFSRLARCVAEGRVLLTTTSRLLDYLVIRDSGTWRVVRDGTRAVIDFEGLSDAAPARWTVKPEHLRGVTFYVDDPAKAAIRFEGRELPVTANPPDETGRPSISVAWDRLQYPL